jgi:hypothetical protein
MFLQGLKHEAEWVFAAIDIEQARLCGRETLQEVRRRGACELGWQA